MGSWAGLSRLPTRVRLTLVFAVTMVVVLAVTGLFVYLRFRAELDRTIDLNLRTQTAALVPLIVGSDAGLVSVNSPLFQGHESFVQVLDMHGRILADAGRTRLIRPGRQAPHRADRPAGVDRASAVGAAARRRTPI